MSFIQYCATENSYNMVKMKLPTLILSIFLLILSFPESMNRPPLEEVTFVFQTIQWTFTNGGVTYMDSVVAVK